MRTRRREITNTVNELTWPGFSRLGEGGSARPCWPGNLASALVKYQYVSNAKPTYMRHLPSPMDMFNKIAGLIICISTV